MFNMHQTKVSEYATVMQKLHRIGKIINHTRVKENLRKTHHITDKSLPQCGTSRCAIVWLCYLWACILMWRNTALYSSSLKVSALCKKCPTWQKAEKYKRHGGGCELEDRNEHTHADTQTLCKCTNVFPSPSASLSLINKYLHTVSITGFVVNLYTSGKLINASLLHH